MTLWSARNGYVGMGAVAALVEADTEDEAREKAVAALRESEEERGRHDTYRPADPSYWDVESVTAVVLPFVGDELP